MSKAREMGRAFKTHMVSRPLGVQSYGMPMYRERLITWSVLRDLARRNETHHEEHLAWCRAVGLGLADSVTVLPHQSSKAQSAQRLRAYEPLRALKAIVRIVGWRYADWEVFADALEQDGDEEGAELLRGIVGIVRDLTEA